MKEKKQIEILKELPGFIVGKTLDVHYDREDGAGNLMLIYDASFAQDRGRETFTYPLTWLIENDWVREI